jgi:hypothetical protein
MYFSIQQEMGESKDIEQHSPTPSREATETEKMRLILTKGLFLRGCVYADESNKISRMVAIHLFDNSVEMALKIIASKRGISPDGKYFFFEELLRKIPCLPPKNDITNLHEQRNIIQHSGDIPDSETVTKYKGHARDFLVVITESEFGLSFDKLSMAFMIEDSKLRGLVENAYSSFGISTAEGYVESIRACNLALTEVKHRVADVSRRGTHLIYTFQPSRLGKFRVAYHRFRDIVARVSRIPQDKLKQDAEFSMQFVTDLILKWQEEGAIREDRTSRQKR